MYTIENVIRNVNGEKRVIKFLAGSGNLTNDLEPRNVRLSSGDEICLIEGFGQDIAFDYYDIGDRDEKVKYFPLEIWGRSAEILGKYGKRGMELTVTGRVEIREKKTKSGKIYEKEVLVLELFQITSRSKRA